MTTREYMMSIPFTDRMAKAVEMVDSAILRRDEMTEYRFQLINDTIYPELFQRVQKESWRGNKGLYEWILFELSWSADGKQRDYIERLLLCQRINERQQNPLPVDELARVLTEIIGKWKAVKEQMKEELDQRKKERQRLRERHYICSGVVEADEYDVERIIKHIRSVTASISLLPENRQKQEAKKRLTVRAVKMALGYHRADNRDKGNRAIEAIRARGLIREIQADEKHKSYIVELVE